jgi:hypothetical protein
VERLIFIFSIVEIFNLAWLRQTAARLVSDDFD